MTREKIIQLAKEAGAYWEHGDFNMPCAIRFDRESDLERFAELVAAEYKRDALRYRWLREQHDEGEGVWFVSGAPSVEKLDDAIDAAMEKVK